MQKELLDLPTLCVYGSPWEPPRPGAHTTALLQSQQHQDLPLAPASLPWSHPQNQKLQKTQKTLAKNPQPPICYTKINKNSEKQHGVIYAATFELLMQKLQALPKMSNFLGVFPLCSALLCYGTRQPNPSQGDFLTVFSPLV